MQRNQNQQDGKPSSQGKNDQQSQPGASSGQQSQSGGGRDQQGGGQKSDSGQAQSRSPQQGGDHGNRSDKQR